MKSGASGTTGSSTPLNRTWIAPAFTSLCLWINEMNDRYDCVHYPVVQE